MNKTKLILMLIFFMSTSSAKAISWKDASDAWDHATDEMSNFFEKLKSDIQNLGKQINSLTNEIDEIRIKTPRINFSDISGRLKVPKERFNFPEWKNFDRLGSSLENFKIGGDIGRIAEAIKYHWGPEIAKCFKSGHLLNVCNYSVCKVDKSITWADDSNKEHWQCELKKAQIDQEAMQTEIEERLGAIGSNIDNRKERLSEKIKPFAD